MKRPQVIADVSEHDSYQLQPCRGLQGTCPFALVREPTLAGEIDSAVRASAWWPRVQQHNGKPLSHHLRLRVALAACPNACTMPQIRDIGMIATMTPTAIRPECNGCGRCEQVCREKAIAVRDGRAELGLERCVGCGQCIRNCPRQEIASGEVKMRVLVGGRMGRHPRWAQELCEVQVASAAAVVRAFLDRVATELPPGGHVADLVEQITMARLRQEVSAAVRASSTECMKSRVPTCPVSSVP